MNPLYKDKVFLSLCAPSMVLLVLSLAGITIESWGKYSLNLLGTSEDWDNFITLYKVPLSISAGIFALFALFTSIHRIKLQNDQLKVQSEQLNDAKKLNEFNIYFKQRDEFDKKFSESVSEWVKSLWQTNNFRLNEFFEDFDPHEVLRREYDPALLNKTTKVICLRIYEFCFGVGRRIYMSDEFKEFMSDVYAQLSEIEDVAREVTTEKKSKFNEYICKNFIERGKITHWRHMYESEWFSDNEKFNLSLAIVRFLSEVEAFSGFPRNTDDLQRLCAQGNSIEHAYFYGPVMILGERDLSPAGKKGRRPLLSSRLNRDKKEH